MYLKLVIKYLKKRLLYINLKKNNLKLLNNYMIIKIK